MKLIIWWCFLMAFLPFLYLFLVKKGWRLLFGVISSVIIIIGYIVTDGIANSILTTEIEKEKKKPFLQLEENLKKLTNDESKTSDSEKTYDEKLILKQKAESEEIAKAKIESEKDEENIKESFRKTFILQKQWIKKWWKDEKAQALLFCGEDFNKELAREKVIGINKKISEIKDFNIIDFGLAENNKIDSLQKKIKNICQQEDNESQRLALYNRPIIWLKNIDKADSKIEKKLLEIIDFEKNSNLEEYFEEIKIGEKKYKKKRTVNLSQFILLATTSSTNTETAPVQLRFKLNHIESFWNKHYWWIFSFSLGIEILVFYLLIKSNRKNKKSQSLFPR
jgi:hypothetical protein